MQTQENNQKKMSNNKSYSNPSTQVIIRTMRIIEDLYRNKDQNTSKFNQKYLKAKKEQSWFFSFLRQIELVDVNNKWIGPDIKQMIKDRSFFPWITELHSARMEYSKFVKGNAPETVPAPAMSNEEIPGLENGSTVVSHSVDIVVPCISIPNEGLYMIQLGNDKYKYMVNLNGNGCTIIPITGE